MRPLLLLLLLGPALLGCSERNQQELQVQVDTLEGGRVHIANPPVSAAGSESWRLVEDLRIGAVGGGNAPDVFGHVSSVTSDSRGRIYILDSQSQEIRVFDPDGAFSHTIGARGSGPGEFTFADLLAIGPGDTLYVRDDGQMRYSVFTSEGRFVRTARRDIVGRYGSAIPSVTSHGIVDWAPVFPEGRSGPRFQLQPVLTGGDSSTEGRFPPLEYTWPMLPSGRMPQTNFDYGIVAAVDTAGAIWFAEAAEYRVLKRGLRGDTTLVFTLPAAGIPLDEAQYAAIRERWSHRPTLMAEILESLPETLPIIQRILPDNDGHLFVFPNLAGSPAGGVVDVFGTDGVHQARLRLPVALPVEARDEPVVHLSGNSLLAVVKDELDVPYVIRFLFLKDDRGARSAQPAPSRKKFLALLR